MTYFIFDINNMKNGDHCKDTHEIKTLFLNKNPKYATV